MEKIFNILLILIFFFSTSCESVKSGLLGQKKRTADEFLVEKKDPLVFPPNFNDLPVPHELNEDQENKDEDIDVEISIKSIGGENETSDLDSNIEKSILEKIQ